MSTPQDQQPGADHVMVIGPDGQPVAVPAEAVHDDDETPATPSASPASSSSRPR